MYVSVLLLSLGLISADGDHLDRRQIRDLLRQLRTPIRDYECLYEGQEKRIKVPDMTGMPEPIRKATERDISKDAGSVTTYQGIYAYRDDDSIHIDVSVRHPDPRQPLKRDILCLFHGKGSKRVIIPDQGGTTGPDFVQPAGTIFIKKAFSQLRVDMYPYLIESVLNEFITCESPGWEDVDGHRCLVIDFPRLGDKGEKRIWGERYWVDVARGGNVLKYEWDDDGSVSARLTEVGLSKERTEDGEFVWLPVAGRMLFYRDGFRPTTNVQSEQTYTVLTGTLKINKQLPDSRFTLDYNLDERIRASARTVNKTKVPNRKGFPLDAETSLKKMLRDPDDPSKQLIAASTSSRSWLFRNGTSVGLIATGISVIAIGTYLKRKYM